MSSSHAAPGPRYSDEQIEIIHAWGKGQAIIAGAGCGKTTTLVAKCRALLERKPDARFAAVSFTEKSASDLREKLSRELPRTGKGSALAGHWVTTIHGLCASVIREFPREAGMDGEESVLAESEARVMWERVLEKLWFDELPDPVRLALERLLDRESRSALAEHLARLKSLHGFGALERFEQGSGDEDTRALTLVAGYVIEAYDRAKRRRGVVDFDDLEKGARRALDHERVREAFHRRFDLVMVDEFQDTNPVQAGIIWKLVRPDLSNLCVVGDPKQSIYRFRDADVSVFDECCSRLPVRQKLTRNYRCRPGIIEFTNRVCERAFEGSAMEYEPLVAGREEDPELEPVARLDVAGPEELAAWIVAETRRGVPLHDMALLLKRIRGAEKWLKPIAAAGVPIAIASGGLFWEDPRVREIAAFLRWWDQPGNALSGAVFLRAPWVGIEDARLDEWLTGTRPLMECFLDSGHPVAEALKPYRGLSARPGELVLALIADVAIEREIGTAALGLWHRCEELSTRGMDFSSVAAELAAAREESRRERDVPPPRNQGQLVVLTIHGSKGLEFPHVILTDFAGKGRAADSPWIYWDRHKGAYFARRDEDGERERKDPVESQWKAEERGKNLAESKRLFYVALTRARERLVLVCQPLKPKEAEAGFDPEKVYGEENWRGWIECGGGEWRDVEAPAAEFYLGASAPVHGAGLESGENIAPDEDFRSMDGNARAKRGSGQGPGWTGPRSEVMSLPAPVPLIRPRHSVTEWNLLSRCPRAYAWKYLQPRLIEEDDFSERFESGGGGPSAVLSAREIGTRVHSCLETGDWEGLREIEKQVGKKIFAAGPLIDWAASADWMRPSEGSREVWSELAFEIPVNGEILVGAVDRLIFDRDRGRATVVDFKITRDPKAPEELLEAYGTQMTVYAWAARRLLDESGEDVREVEASLVNISTRGVSAVPVPLPAQPVIAEGIERTVQRVSEILSRLGTPIEARTSGLCNHCDFRSECREGREFSAREAGRS